MERTISYGAAGCFIGTVAALVLFKYNSNAFLLFLIPMWAMIFGIAVARVVNVRGVEKKEKAL